VIKTGAVCLWPGGPGVHWPRYDANVSTTWTVDGTACRRLETRDYTSSPPELLHKVSPVSI